MNNFKVGDFVEYTGPIGEWNGFFGVVMPVPQWMRVAIKHKEIHDSHLYVFVRWQDGAEGALFKRDISIVAKAKQ
jgi:hypothetical protein